MSFNPGFHHICSFISFFPPQYLVLPSVIIFRFFLFISTSLVHSSLTMSSHLHFPITFLWLHSEGPNQEISWRVGGYLWRCLLRWVFIEIEAVCCCIAQRQLFGLCRLSMGTLCLRHNVFCFMVDLWFYKDVQLSETDGEQCVPVSVGICVCVSQKVQTD